MPMRSSSASPGMKCLPAGELTASAGLPAQASILAASVRAMRDALAGLKGGPKPPMASPAELATAIRIAEYLSQDSRWPDPS
jgi:hypothetical protein